jgi:hypothetical protein
LNHLTLSSGDGSFQAYAAQFAAEDKARLVPGVAYNIQPINTSETYRWVVAPDVTLIMLKNDKLVQTANPNGVIDPTTGLSLTLGNTTIDPVTGLPVAHAGTPGTTIGPTTGLPIASGNTGAIDPITGLPTAATDLTTDADAAVQAWLSLMDNDDYAQSWETAGKSFHEMVPQTDWVAKLEKIRRPLGKLISRKAISTQRTVTLSGKPDGSYFIARFETSFANFKSAVETVTFSLEKNGQWKAMGYLIQPRTGPADQTADQAAIAAAQTWLASIDAGHYAESWTAAAGFFRGAVTQDNWVSAVKAVREPLGKLVSRSMNSANTTTSLPGAPDGQYVVMRFETSFANKQSAVETVTFMLEKDGQWRAAGYYIK